MNNYIIISIDDDGPLVRFEDDDAKNIMDTLVIGFGELSHNVIPEWSNRLGTVCEDLQKRMEKAQ